jgi:20S proteasome alpha/beta subunit
MTADGMGGDIVTASDRMISAIDDTVQATEALKARKISKTWALMFAGDSAPFLPIVLEVKNRLGDFDKAYDLATVQTAVSEIYREKFSQQFCGQYLSRYGISSIADFRASGLADFGQKFYEICDAIDKFSLGIEFLGYGFDDVGAPHIFEVQSPGIVTNHDYLGYAVIGSGSYMATAALRRKKMPYDRDSVVYRILEAKFSAETASGVGESTTVLTMNSAGKDKSIGYGSIGAIKESWKFQLRQPEPQDALDIIKKVLGN